MPRSEQALQSSAAISQKRLVQALMRKKLSCFIERCFYEVNPTQAFNQNWHIQALCYQLEKIATGKTKRLLITLPPRNLKSLCASIAFPAFLLGHDPSKRIIAVSYAQELANAHSASFRKILHARWYQELFAHTKIAANKDSESETRTTKGGYRLSTAIGGSLTGRGGSLLIIDDPMKAADAASKAQRERVKEWYDTTLLSRLDDKQNGAIVLIMQRLHVDDLAGHVLETGHWEHLNLPAIADAPMRIDLDGEREYLFKAGELLHAQRDDMAVLDELKSAMGTQAFSAQYLQSPIPDGGAMIKWNWMAYYDQLPPKGAYPQEIVQSWDTASKTHELADYSVGITALKIKEALYIIDINRKKLDYPALKREIIAYKKRFNAQTLLIEDKGSGSSLIQDLKREHIACKPIMPEGDKVMRMDACTALIEGGMLHLPQTAPWLNDFKAEMLAFPHGRHDDQVDALSQLINWSKQKRTFDFSIYK